MTIHVNIGEAKTRLSSLVAAALRGEEVVLSKAGVPQARLVAVEDAARLSDEERRAKRLSAIGMWKHLFTGYDLDPRAFKPTEAEIEERYRRKFGDPA